MTTATVTSKGQITIPAAVRVELKIAPGDRVEFVKISDCRFELIAATQDITQLKGLIKAKRPVSIDEMNAAIKGRASQT
jgi:AbrB family looped-hinge helix DNA binding protein